MEDYERLLPSWNEKNRLETQEIPRLKANLTQIEEQLENESSELVELEATLKKKEKAVNLLKEQETQMNFFDKEENDLKRTRQQIDTLQKQLPSNTEETEEKSLEEINSEYEKLQEKQKNNQEKINKIQINEKKIQNEINKTLSEINKLREELLNAKNSSEKIENQRNRINQLTENLEKIKENLQIENEKLGEIKIKLNQIETQQKKLQSEFQSKENKVQNKKDKFQTDFLKVQNLVENAKRIQIDQVLEKKQAEMAKRENIQAKIKENETNLQESTKQIRSIQDQLSLSEVAKRNLEDNIEYKKQENELNQLKKEILEVESKSTVVPKTVFTEKAKAEKTLKILQAKFSELQGMNKIYKEQIVKIDSNLKSVTYKGVEKDFKEMQIQLKTYEMAGEDLDRYYYALDRAIMQYHTMKIEEINKILKDLWQATYKGSDIDTIEIRADNDGTKSYNYRVIMIKGDTELDMRGRCSAGQKVLASLIIRLALAESLGVNCGIIALDEPTTNLDRENIDSFANGLAEYLFLFPSILTSFSIH